MSNNQSHITIREATPADAGALARLAELDSAQVPAQPLLVAYSGDDLMAAASKFDGAAIANPFRPTAELVAMLRIEAGVRVRQPATGPVGALTGPPAGRAPRVPGRGRGRSATERIARLPRSHTAGTHPAQ